MSTNTQLSVDQAIQIFSGAYGQLVWRVRCEDFGILRLDFGAPHLRVHEPLTRTRKTQDGSPLLVTSRMALPEGQWHLFVEAGHWRVEANGYACARTDELPLEQRAFIFVDGQKLTSVAYDSASGEWLFDFEFGGRLSIKAAPPHPEPDAYPDVELNQWIFFTEGGKSLSCDERGLLFLGE